MAVGVVPRLAGSDKLIRSRRQLAMPGRTSLQTSVEETCPHASPRLPEQESSGVNRLIAGPPLGIVKQEDQPRFSVQRTAWSPLIPTISVCSLIATALLS